VHFAMSSSRRNGTPAPPPFVAFAGAAADAGAAPSPNGASAAARLPLAGAFEEAASSLIARAIMSSVLSLVVTASW